MAAITIAANALWSASGITVADDVTVNAGVTLTLDVVGACNSFVCNGTLSDTRNTITGIHAVGAFTFNNGSVLDISDVATPTTALCTLSSDKLSGQMIVINNGADVRLYDANPRTRYTNLTADTVLGSNVINVATAANWAVGDVLVFEDAATQGITPTLFRTTISAIAGTQVTLATPAPTLLDGTTSPLFVANMSGLIVVDAVAASAGNGPYVYVSRSNTASDNKWLMRGVVFRRNGRNSYQSHGLRFAGGWGQGRKGEQNYNIMIQDCCFDEGHGCILAVGTEVHIDRVVGVAAGNDDRAVAFERSQSHGISTDTLVMNMGWTYASGSGGAHKSSMSGFNVVNSGRSTFGFNPNAQEPLPVTGGILRSSKTLFRPENTALITFRDMVLSNNLDLTAIAGFGDIVLINSLVEAPIGSYIKNSALTGTMSLLDKDKDPTLQEKYTGVGAYFRDSTVALTPPTKPASLRLEPSSTTDPLKYSVSATALVGTATTVIIEVQANAAYNGATRPQIRIAGVEFDVTQQMSVVNGAWETVTLTTPIAITTHTITVSIEAIGTSGAAWVDSLKINGSEHDMGDMFIGGTEISTVVDITLTGKSVTLTGLIPGSDVVILQAGTNTVLASVDQEPTTSWTYNEANSNNIDIGINKPGYKPQYIYGYALNQLGASLPIKQSIERSYV